MPEALRISKAVVIGRLCPRFWWSNAVGRRKTSGDKEKAAKPGPKSEKALLGWAVQPFPMVGCLLRPSGGARQARVRKSRWLRAHPHCHRAGGHG